MRNSYFRYIEETPATGEQLQHIARLLTQPVDDIADLSDLAEDESNDDSADAGLRE